MSLETMKARMNAIGGSTTDGRINDGKLKSLHSAMKNSYQAEWITYNKQKHRCLINPVKMSPDYDQKEISIDFCCGMKVGEIFYWDRTNSWWMTINQRLTEEAYFRGEIRQCDYEIETDKKKYWVWMRGPVETSLIWKQKHNITWNDMNYTLLFYIVKNDDTNEFFTRHRMVKFDGHNWRVAAVDRYSQENILEVYLEEANDNEMQDEMIPIEPEPINKKEPYIEGSYIVNPYDTDLIFTIQNADGGSWSVGGSRKVKITQSDDSSCTIDVLTGKSGNFELQYIKDDEVIVSYNIIIDSL